MRMRDRHELTQTNQVELIALIIRYPSREQVSSLPNGTRGTQDVANYR